MNTWVIINVGGGPTDDKPAVHLAPPKDGEAVSSFMNIRVANIAECYERWKRLGAEFLTEPMVITTQTSSVAPRERLQRKVGFLWLKLWSA